jgi:hypothetical protein
MCSCTLVPFASSFWDFQLTWFHKLIFQVPSNSPKARYISEMKTKCGLSSLAKRIVRWFNETKAAGKAFDCRFTGKDSRGFLHNFMLLQWNHFENRVLGKNLLYMFGLIFSWCCVNVLPSLTALRLKMKILLINMLVEFISRSTVCFLPYISYIH